MSAIVIPFPRVRNRAWIARHARRMTEMSQAAAERHLANHLGIHAATMSKRGFAADVIRAEVQAIEAAIRAELWRVVLTPGGAA